MNAIQLIELCFKGLLSVLAAAMSPKSSLKVLLAIFSFTALFGLNLYFAEKVSRFSETQPLFGKPTYLILKSLYGNWNWTIFAPGIYLFILTILSFFVAFVAGLGNMLANQDEKMSVNILPGTIRRLLQNHQEQSYELTSADNSRPENQASRVESAQIGVSLNKLVFWPVALAFLISFILFLLVLPVMAVAK